jgi:hypothetical protein
MMTGNGRVAPYAPNGQGWARRLWVGLRSTWVPLTAIVLFNADSFIFASIGGGAEYSGTLAPFMLGYLLVPIGFVGIWWPRVAGALALVAYGCAVVSEALWADWEFAAYGAVHPLATGVALYVGLMLLAARRAAPSGRHRQVRRASITVPPTRDALNLSTAPAGRVTW